MMKRKNTNSGKVEKSELRVELFLNNSAHDESSADRVKHIQIWTTDNLDVSTFRNGDAIPEAKTEAEWKEAGMNAQPAWCYYENDAANGKKYGKLYNWFAVNDARGLAPQGWHVPSDEEWTKLCDHLGGRHVAGEKMKSTTGWDDDGNGTNEIGRAHV